MDIRLENLRDILMKEIQCVNDRGELSPELVEPTKNIVKTLKAIHDMEMQDWTGGYSEGTVIYRNHPYDGSSYGYTREHGSYRSDYRTHGGMSGHEGNHHMMTDLENAMRRATNETDRERIRALMEQMRR